MSGDALSVNAICKERGKIEINKPEAISSADQKEIQVLQDLAQLLELYQALKAVDFGNLPLDAIGAMRDISEHCHPKSLCYKMTPILIVDALTKTVFDEENEKAIKTLIKAIKPVSEKFQAVFADKNPLVSIKVKNRYKELEKAETGALHKRALNALKKVMEEIGMGLSPKASAELKTKQTDWVDNIIVDQINSLIWEKCEPGFVEVKPVGPKPKPKSWMPSWLNLGLRIGSGYGGRAKGKHLPELLAEEERGLLLKGAASFKFDLSARYALQIDYSFSAPYDVKGDDNLVSNKDDGRLSLIARPLDNLDLFVQAGWLYYRNDYPSAATPDINALQDHIRINYRPINKLSINFDQKLLTGWTNESFPVDRSDFSLIEAEGELGVSYDLGMFIPFAGGIGGYGKDGEIYGGFLGTGFKRGDHEADLRADYINTKIFAAENVKDKGINLALRYLFNVDRGGAGAILYYNNNLDGQHQMGGGVFGRVKLVEFLGNALELQPFVNVAALTNDDKAVNIMGGIMLRFGGLRPGKPSFFKPYSIKPLLEEE